MAKGNIYPYIFILALTVLLTSCEKTDKNGLLDGAWQLTSLINLSSNKQVADKNSRIFVYFKLDLMEFRTTTESVHYFARFEHIDDSLFIGTVYKAPFDSIVSISELSKYGIGNGRLYINDLSDSRFTITSDEYKSYYRKY